jgi:hypothetical protein
MIFSGETNLDAYRNPADVKELLDRLAKLSERAGVLAVSSRYGQTAIGYNLPEAQVQKLKSQ